MWLRSRPRGEDPAPRMEAEKLDEFYGLARPSSKKPRFDVSLVRLTQQFMELIKEAPDGVLDMNHVAWVLGVRKRRVYDITNVLDGIHLVRKKSKNLIEWVGKSPQEKLGYDAQSRKLAKETEELTSIEESLDELIKDCANQLYKMTEDEENSRLAYVTYQDIHSIKAFQDQIVIAIKAPQETKLEIPIPKEEIIQVHLKSTKGPIDVFVCECNSQEGTGLVQDETDCIIIENKGDVSPGEGKGVSSGFDECASEALGKDTSFEEGKHTTFEPPTK
ncbi:transcription factor E2F6 [Callorhinchus milii]|uniref:transcription factor E2F6 n=1 Tax=Callorhinchus milii TaxID=7868 RepID=UPI00045717B6|nr:transcription factor E2F6 [Callorhinchus milii]|eukprot:gi/632976206/ref/XP_007904666.1/ PREDICTED: transcription factor E2F6 [Callorhinchus milii]